MTTTLIEPPSPATVASPERRRLPWDELATFAVVTLLASAALLGLQRMFGASMGAPAGQAIQWVQFAPAMGVLAAVWRHRVAGGGRTGLAADWRIDRTVGARMVAALSAPAILVAVWMLMPVFGGSAALADPMIGGPAIAAVLVWFALGCVGEELGWRCWLQPILQRRIGLIGAATVTGIAWGVWHIQTFSAGLGHVSGFLATCIALSVMMAMLLEPLRSGRLWVAATFHCSLNLMLLIWTGSSAPSAGQQWIFAGVCAAGALITGMTRGIRSDCTAVTPAAELLGGGSTSEG